MGREVGGGGLGGGGVQDGGQCTPVAGSCQSMAETTTVS